MDTDRAEVEPLDAGRTVMARRSFLMAGAAALSAPATVLAGPTNPRDTRQEADMDIKRNGTQPSKKGDAEYFTGSVRVDSPFQADAPARVGGAVVTFDPSARTAWHTHPLGQTLIVTAGLGWAQVEGGPVEEIRPGDIVWFPPKVKHWHGASATTGMTHIAIAEKLDGKAVDWLEKVTDEQYKAPATKK